MGKAGIPIRLQLQHRGRVRPRNRAIRPRRGHVVGMDGPLDAPIARGMVWNMVYDPEAAPDSLPTITHDELWRRLADFLHEPVPVAEPDGVRLAAHPDDPPMPTMRDSRGLSISRRCTSS